MNQSFHVLSYGAMGDGRTDDARAIQATIDVCAQNGGGRVILDGGQTYLIYLEYCSDVRVSGVLIRKAPFWTLHLAGCEHVVVSGIAITNDLDCANSDGIDPDHSRDILIALDDTVEIRYSTYPALWNQGVKPQAVLERGVREIAI